MRRTTSCAARQLLSSAPFKHTPEISCVTRASSQCLRPFSNTAVRVANYNIVPMSKTTQELSDLAGTFATTRKNRAGVPANYNPTNALSLNDEFTSTGKLLQRDAYEEPHHFHIYATKHNTHITLTTPNRDPIISVACGNIGFRKSGRKHYDSAFQLAAYVMGQIREKGINAQINKLEVVLRGFGAGREAVTKALLGAEGTLLRHKIVKVADATRLKFGGTRGNKPRRLG